ncbi:hypothetical protein C2G38_2207558 [Gigaspora rosea]|uniref:Uncharacterized protein n=1 Tax=Gigaspora rosea TaxID=44941 RepID=A0A397UK78_9GLOM|nr:hypothetical protein C2G38_2207558 [Gigaspora rosea]
MQKTKFLATIIVLFAFIFAYLHATPLYLAAVGDKFVAVLKKLDSKFEFKELNKGYVSAYGIINKGIIQNASEHYFVQFSKNNFTSTLSFAKYGIPIHPPKAGPWGKGNKYAADIDKIIDSKFSISKIIRSRDRKEETPHSTTLSQNRGMEGTIMEMSNRSSNPYKQYIVVGQLKRDSDEELEWSNNPMVSTY